MTNFLREELSELPPTLSASLLQQLEAVVREAARIQPTDSVRLEQRCVLICAQLKAIVGLANTFKDTLRQQEK